MKRFALSIALAAFAFGLFIQGADAAKWTSRSARGYFPGTYGSRSVPTRHPRDRRVRRVCGGKNLAGGSGAPLAFTPDNIWRHGRYQIIIQNTLEDLAGNNIGKPFDVDLFEGVERRLPTKTVKLSFEIQNQRREK